ncbi:MAG: helix-turn-helix transcriptional regulator [Akkermansiaceae bacterium]|nr:helix-turn-helix transcriptional regulator [Akkermansiaceae bacterium]
MRNDRPQNIIGANVRTVRSALGWTQADLARKCQLKGFDITRTGISQVESLFRRVTDHEMVLIARALRVPVTDLIPKRLPPWIGRPRKDSDP